MYYRPAKNEGKTSNSYGGGTCLLWKDEESDDGQHTEGKLDISTTIFLTIGNFSCDKVRRPASEYPDQIIWSWPS